jgi:spore maturation protein CgeB
MRLPLRTGIAGIRDSRSSHTKYRRQASSRRLSARHLHELGHEAHQIVANLLPAQIAWLQEHARSRRERADAWIRARSGRGLRRLVGSILLRQIEAFNPDVIHLAALDVLDLSLILEIRSRVRLLVVQVATRLPEDRWRVPFDLALSSLPNFVDRFRRLGARAEWLPLAFDSRVLAAVGPTPRDVAVSFVGSITGVHEYRAAVVAAVGMETGVDVWTDESAHLEGRPGIQFRDPAWGLDMYRVLARSRLTVNCHGRTEDDPPVDANNFRLFEATGMGAMLVTDRLRTLSQLFSEGREIATFGSAEECAEVVRHYSDRPAEAQAMAAAGQARTLREHTWANRMEFEMAAIQALS